MAELMVIGYTQGHSGQAELEAAQAYNLEQLLEHANAHLSGLSRRYRLVRGGSPLGLLVVDVDMGDEGRSVHSLSSGETFLVTLILISERK